MPTPGERRYEAYHAATGVSWLSWNFVSPASRLCWEAAADGDLVQAAAAAELEAELERYKNPLPGDLAQQAAAWVAVNAALKDAGLLEFFGGDFTGRGRAVAFIQHIAKELSDLRAIVEPLNRLLSGNRMLEIEGGAGQVAVTVSGYNMKIDSRIFFGPTIAAALAAAERARRARTTVAEHPDCATGGHPKSRPTTGESAKRLRGSNPNPRPCRRNRSERMATDEQVIFWLNRRIRELEIAAAQPSDSGMAKAGMSYGKRQATYAQSDKAADAGHPELEAMRQALEIVRANPAAIRS